MNPNEQSDDELLKNLASRAPGSLAAIADRYLDILYDFALRTSLDAALASASVLGALTTAAAQVDPAQRLALSPWLLGLTRDDVLDRSRVRTGRNGEEGNAPAVTESSFSQLPQDAPGIADAELAAWAWQSARAQRPRDYSLLDLSVRQGLTADEVADATGMSHSGIYAVLGRLRGSLEETFLATVLFYRGGWACPELAAIVEAQPQAGPAVRRDIARHAEACSICRETRRGYPSPANLLAAFTVLGADSETRSSVLDIEVPPTIDSSVAVTGLIEPDDTDVEAPALEGEPADEDVPADWVEPVVTVTGDELAGSASDIPSPLSDDQSRQTAVDRPAPDSGEGQDPGPLKPGSDSPGGDEELAPEVTEAVSDGTGTPGPEPGVAGVAAATGPRRSSGDGAGTSTRSPEADRTHPGGNPERERLAALSRGGYLGGPPPRRPWEGFADWLGENGPGRLSLIILLVGATVLAAYLGLAIGDSIEGGSSSSAATGLSALPTSQPGSRQIACGTGPIDVDQAAPITLSFDSDGRILPGFQIADISVTPASQTADAKSVSAKAQQSLTMALLAQPLPGAPGRVDEYKVNVTFAKSTEKAVSECTVRVHAPLITPTAVASTSASVTPPPTARPGAQATVPVAATSASVPTAAAANTALATLTPTRTATVTPTRTPVP